MVKTFEEFLEACAPEVKKTPEKKKKEETAEDLAKWATKRSSKVATKTRPNQFK